jgi:hypothetical protein
MVVAIPGIMNETQNRNSIEWLKGIFVRARIQEINTAMGKLIPTTKLQTRMLLRRAIKMAGWLKPLDQLFSPHEKGSTKKSCAVLKEFMSSRTTGRIR